MEVAKKSLQMSMGLNHHREENAAVDVVSQTSPETTNPYETVRRVAKDNAVVVFSMSDCCMCTVAKQLLLTLGVAPTVVELDRHSSGALIQAVLYQIATSDGQQLLDRHVVPAVFVGGKFLGGIETLMGCHINGSLVPLLKDAGALWL